MTCRRTYKSKKIMLRVLPVLLLVVVVLASNVFAVSTDMPTTDKKLGSVNDAANTIWGTVLLIFQILAIAAIVFAGIRYMFASADQKADIKKSMIILVLGAILVFGASTVAKFIMTATNEVIGNVD